MSLTRRDSTSAWDRLGVREYQYPDFEISWAGEGPWNRGLCFGSEDGRIRFVTDDGEPTGLPHPIFDSGEAINGVALSGQWLAASTRSEVAIVNLWTAEGDVRSTDYPGGAHGVVATAAGGFLAPLGTDGLLSVRPGPGPAPSFQISRATEKVLNFTKLALLASDRSEDHFACAARRDGMVALSVVQNEFRELRYVRAPGLDIVDLCAIGTPACPLAVAGLGADGSVHLSRDLGGAEMPQRFRIADLRGTPYTILHSGGHLFVLTSEALYAFPDVASRFLAGGLIRGAGFGRPIRAVDAYLAYDRILIVLCDRVLDVPAGSLATVDWGSDQAQSSMIEAVPTPKDRPWELGERAFASVA